MHNLKRIVKVISDFVLVEEKSYEHEAGGMSSLETLVP